MSTTILRMGARYVLMDAKTREHLKRLPVANYVVREDITGLYLEQTDAFQLPKKIYGKAEKDAARFLDTYEERLRQKNKSTGVLLSGEKGSGKSMTAQLLSVRGAARGIVTLVVNAPLHGDAFNELLQRVEQPCIVLFDEFEKVYNEKDKQQALLTMLEGVVSSRKLFVFTCNNRYAVDEHMINRPGRVFYAIEYEGLETDFIEEYCRDNLKNKKHVPAMLRVARLFYHFNFDSLQAIVEEMNRYGESPSEVLRVLNVNVASERHQSFEVKLEIGGKAAKLLDDEVHANPLMAAVTVYVDRKHADRQIMFSPGELTHVDGKGGSFTYVKKNMKLTLTRPRAANFSMSGYADGITTPSPL